MVHLSTMLTVIAGVAVGCAVLSFAVFLYAALKLIPEGRNKADQAIRQFTSSAQNFTGVSAKDIAELVKALASLADSLVKAGPALWSLIGSALFLFIASLAAGVFSSPPAQPGAAGGKTNAADTNTVEANAAAGSNQQADENLPVNRP